MHGFVRARAYTTLALGLLAGACGGGDGGTGPGAGFDAQYSLQRVNHIEIPAQSELMWGRATFRSGTLDLWPDGAWEMQIKFERENGEQQSLEDGGGYEVDGPTLHLSSDEYDDEFDGAMDGNTVTIKYDFDGDGAYETDFTFTR